MPTQRIIITPGQSVFIPSNAILLGIEKSGDADVQSDCIDLTNIEEYKCYYFQWELEGPNGGSDAWENGILDEIEVGGVTYALAINGYLSNDDGFNKLRAAMNNIPSMKDVNIPAAVVVGDLRKWSACFKTVPSLAAVTLLKFHSSDNTYVQQVPVLVGDGAPCACLNPSS